VARRREPEAELNVRPLTIRLVGRPSSGRAAAACRACRSARRGSSASKSIERGTFWREMPAAERQQLLDVCGSAARPASAGRPPSLAEIGIGHARTCGGIGPLG
jgi:hypothetical protein